MRDMPPAESKYFCTLMRFAASPCPTLPRLWRVHGFAWTCGTMAEGTSASTFSCLVIQIKWPEFWLRQFVYHVYTCTPRLPMLFVREGTFNSCHGALASAVGWYDQSKKYKDVQYHINCLRLREQMLQSWQHSIQYGVALTLHKQCASWAGAYQQLPRPKVPKPFDQATRLDAATAGWSASAAGASFEALKWTCWSAPGAVSETLQVIFGLTSSRLAFELIGPSPRLQWSLNLGRAIYFRSTFLAFQWGSEAAKWSSFGQKHLWDVSPPLREGDCQHAFGNVSLDSNVSIQSQEDIFFMYEYLLFLICSSHTIHKECNVVYFLPTHV